MAETNVAALYRAVIQQLAQNGTEMWGSRIYNTESTQTGNGNTRPYVIMVMVSDIEPMWTRVPGAITVMYIKCVADDMETSFAGAGRINDLLHDAGTIDNGLPGYAPPSKLLGGSFWNIATATKEQSLHMIENVENARPIYHDGARYKFRMERN